jgi:hypothetical protein
VEKAPRSSRKPADEYLRPMDNRQRENESQELAEKKLRTESLRKKEKL